VAELLPSVGAQDPPGPTLQRLAPVPRAHAHVLLALRKLSGNDWGAAKAEIAGARAQVQDQLPFLIDFIEMLNARGRSKMARHVLGDTAANNTSDPLASAAEGYLSYLEKRAPRARELLMAAWE